MSDAAKTAYDEALRRIETARETQADRLDLSSLPDLSHFPPEIAGRPHLRAIEAFGTGVTDLGPLSGLHGLRTLDLRGTKVNDLSPLARLSNLRLLYLDNTSVSELSPLSGLNNLMFLRLSDTRIGNLSPLAGLTQLISLDLSNSGVTDLTPLLLMRDLQQVYLANTKPEDFTLLSRITALRSLDLSNTAFADAEILLSLINLEWLSLSGTQISDITPLENLHELRHLDVDRTQVADLRPALRLGKLGSRPYTSLSYVNTPFARSTPQLLTLSQSGYHKRRTRETLAYLKTLPPWPEPLVPDATPEPAPESGLPLHWQAEKIALAVPVLGQDEADDPIRRTLFDALGDQVADLKRVSGNLDESAYRLACKLEDLLAQGYANMEPLRLHLVIEDLRRLQMQARPEADRDYLLALAAVVETGPGLTLDTAAVTLFVDRARRNRLERLDEVQAETQIALAQAVAQSPLSAEDVATIATRAADARITDQFTAIRPTLTRNYVLVVATYVLATGFQGVIGNEAHQGFLWLVQNAESIRALAPTWGEPFLVWIIPILEKAQQVVMATDHAIRSRNEPE